MSFCLVAPSAPCQSSAEQEPRGHFKRLVLKDGSYELISQYSIQGDRVRYYSTERYDWEELPVSLVDWEATEKYGAQAEREAAQRRQEAHENAAEERSEYERRAPSVAPGLRLPLPEGVFLLDIYKNQSELSQLTQNGADLKKNMAGNILRSIVNPVSGSRQTIELSGLRARIQSHVLTPVIYFSTDPNDSFRGYSSETAKDHLRIVRCIAKGDNRVVIRFDIAAYGKVTMKADYVEATIEPVSSYWVKIAPTAPMPPGEYALVELDDSGSVNAFVWDFGVDPAAAANRAAERQSIGREEPVLIQKPGKK